MTIYTEYYITILPLLLAWMLDLLLADPAWLPHPVVGFGKLIAFGERLLNRGSWRRLKGGLMCGVLVAAVFAAVFFADRALAQTSIVATAVWRTVLIFFCLAGTTLIREVRAVFTAVDKSLDLGRKQVARIVGRDTSQLSAHEVRTAALETLAENLSDGVVAPLFWLAVGGVPAMMTYKMINTLDSMVGYRNERYRRFGTVSARLDDVANFIPARLTAVLMLLPSMIQMKWSRVDFTLHYANHHASPNSGWPEAALASVLDCRFGGPHIYFGEVVDKPYIGSNDRQLNYNDMIRSVRLNRWVEVASISLIILVFLILHSSFT